MSVSFSEAALDRIAQCASSAEVERGASAAGALLERYLAQGFATEAPGDDEFVAAPLRRLVGDLWDAPTQFRAFAELLELAVRVGYVDLEGWAKAATLERALRRFLGLETENPEPTPPPLVAALFARFARRQWRAPSRDDRAFFAFASLLHLSTRVRDDDDAQRFLHESTRERGPGDDLPFLLSPRHFAEAVTFGTAGGVPAESALGGLAALRYLRWLGEILQRVEHVGGLAEDFVRVARWSHHAPGVRRRLNFWAERMSEWAESGVDAVGEDAWRRLDETVLIPIEIMVGRVLPSAASAPSADTPAPSIEQLIEQSVAEGRIGAARKWAREAALAWSREVEATAHEERGRKEEQLILACERLAALGQPDAAAVIVAPFLDQLSAASRRAALELMAAARRAGRAALSSPTEASSHPPTAPFFAPQPAPRSPGGSEETGFAAT